MAKTIGSFAMPKSISGERIFPAESPKKTSALINASCKEILGVP